MEQIAKTIKYVTFLALVTYVSTLSKADILFYSLFVAFVFLINVPAMAVGLTQPDGVTVRYEKTFCITNLLLLSIGGMILSHYKGFDLFWPIMGSSFLIILAAVAAGSFIPITDDFYKDILRGEIIAIGLGSLITISAGAANVMGYTSKFLVVVGLAFLCVAAILSSATVRLRYSIPTALCALTWSAMFVLR
jgi:hypothetical protein